MAIAYDATSNNSSSSSTNVTWSHTCTGSNRGLFLFVIASGGTPTATYNGVSMTLQTSNAGTMGYSFFLENPASGSNTVSISASSGILGGVATSYTGVLQASAVDVKNFSNVNATTIALSLTSTVDNCWFVAGGSSPTTGMSAGANTTQRANPSFTGGIPVAIFACDSNGPKALAGSLTLNMNTSNASNTQMFGIMMKPSITDYPITIAQGSFSYTGYAVAITKGLAYVLSLAQASFSYTGYTLSFILELYTRVTNRVKHATTVTNRSKTASASVTNRAKHATTVTNRPKS